jgi:hypothetical protein
VDFRTEFVARFDYGSTVPWISRLYDGAISAVAGPERLVLRSSVALSGEDLKTAGDFTVEEGQSVAFVLSYGASYHGPPSAIDPFESLERTETFWRAWSDRCPDVGPWTEAVKRSLVTLKADLRPDGRNRSRRDHVPSRAARRRQELGLPLLLARLLFSRFHHRRLEGGLRFRLECEGRGIQPRRRNYRSPSGPTRF